MRETTHQAAKRHGLKVASLYRRLERLRDTGRITLNSSDYVAGRLFPDSSTWDEVCALTLPIGRPRKKDPR